MHFFKINISLILIGLSFLARAQIGDYLNSKDFDWSKWEVFNSKDEKIKFLTDSLWGFDELTIIKTHDNYKIVDINGDDIPDIIYKNKTSGGSHQTIFYLNMKDSKVELLNTDEELLDIKRHKPWRAITFQTAVNNCCGGKDLLLKTYSPAYQEDNLTFYSIYPIIIRENLSLIRENLPPLRVEIIQVPELRLSPTSQGNNVIKMYNIGDIGFAVASTRENAQRTWWLVLMKEPDNNLRAGWMLKNNLKISMK